MSRGLSSGQRYALLLFLTWFPWLSLLIYLGIYCPWVLDDQRPGGLVSSTWPWIVLWHTLTPVVLFRAINESHSAEVFQRTQVSQTGAVNLEDSATRRSLILSIFCGLLCTLPALSIALIIFLVSVPNGFEGLTLKGNTISLPEAVTSSHEPVPATSQTSEKPSAYWLAVDVSKSSLGTPKDSRLREVCDVAKALFSRDATGSLSSPLIQDGAGAEAIFFAGGEASNYKPSQETGSSIRDFGSRLCERLKALLDQPLTAHQNPDRNHSDIMTALDVLVANSKQAQEKYSHITVLMFSDFFHDARGMQPNDIDRSVRLFADRLKLLHHVHFVGLVLPRLDDETSREPQSSEIDIQYWLKLYAASARNEPGSFTLTPVEDATSDERSQQGARLAFTAYRRQPVEPVEPGQQAPPLNLKYLRIPPTTVPSWLHFPEGSRYRHVLLGLQQRLPQASLRSLVVNFGGGHSAQKDFSLEFGPSQLPWSPYGGGDGRPRELSVRLWNPGNVTSHGELDLLVAVPESETTYVVPLDVFSAISAIAFGTLRWVMTIAVIMLLALSFEASGLRARLRGTRSSGPTREGA